MSFKTLKDFAKKTTKEQSKDIGIILGIVLVLIGIFAKNLICCKIALPVLVLSLIFPMAYYPLAVLWFGLSHILGIVSSKLLLTLVFIIIVLPIGLIRRMLGKDSLKLKNFKKGTNSVMETRNCTFRASDLEKPY